MLLLRNAANGLLWTSHYEHNLTLLLLLLLFYLLMSISFYYLLLLRPRCCPTNVLDAWCGSMVTNSYYRGAQGVVLVYDIADNESFKALDRWIEELDTYT